MWVEIPQDYFAICCGVFQKKTFLDGEIMAEEYPTPLEVTLSRSSSRSTISSCSVGVIRYTEKPSECLWHLLDCRKRLWISLFLQNTGDSVFHSTLLGGMEQQSRGDACTWKWRTFIHSMWTLMRQSNLFSGFWWIWITSRGNKINPCTATNLRQSLTAQVYSIAVWFIQTVLYVPTTLKKIDSFHFPRSLKLRELVFSLVHCFLE